MGLAREGAVQMWENKTSPDLAIRDTDFIYFLGVECLVGFLSFLPPFFWWLFLLYLSGTLN